MSKERYWPNLVHNKCPECGVELEAIGMDKISCPKCSFEITPEEFEKVVNENIDEAYDEDDDMFEDEDDEDQPRLEDGD